MYVDTKVKQWDVFAVIPGKKGIEKQNGGPMTRARADEMVTRLLVGETKSPRAYVVRSSRRISAPAPKVTGAPEEVAHAAR